MFFIHMSTQFRWSEKIPNQAIEIASLLSSNDRLVVCPQIADTNVYFESSFFSAFSDANIYFIDPDQAEIIGMGGEATARTFKELFDKHKGPDLLGKLPPDTTIVLCKSDYFGNIEDVNEKVLYQDEKLMMLRVQ